MISGKTSRKACFVSMKDGPDGCAKISGLLPNLWQRWEMMINHWIWGCLFFISHRRVPAFCVASTLAAVA
jgi:hypothetical protein